MNTRKGYGQYDKVISVKLNNDLLSIVEKTARAHNITCSEAIRKMIKANSGNVSQLSYDDVTRIDQTMEGVQEAIFELENHMDVLKRQMKSITKSL